MARPFDPLKGGDVVYRRQFKLMNRVGRLGRQGVRDFAERSEKRILRSASAPKRKNFKPKG